MKTKAKKKKQIIHNGGYEVNKTYHNHYWNRKFTVLEIHNPFQYNWSVTVKWEDGRIAQHCTMRDKRDREIK